VTYLTACTSEPANSLERLPEALLSRLRIVYFPEPGPEHSNVIVAGMVIDLERAWRLPEGTISLGNREKACLVGLPPRQMRHALVDMLGSGEGCDWLVLH